MPSSPSHASPTPTSPPSPSEYGENWHNGGRLNNKQNVFDDFHAAAEFLVAQGYTSPQRITGRGEIGGSNDFPGELIVIKY